jgi:hypothetical protein
MEHWANRGWLIRHGFSPSEGNSDFSNWLVPGVGQAPVVEFQVLITLFVLAIGPLNYWLLQRSGRLHLLVVTVPLGALLLTGGLLLYGIISDGFYTKVRIHSVTLLDQQQGEAVTQSRLSYYASLSPADGLRFRDTTAIYSINPSYSDRFAMNSGQPRLELRWREQQHLSRGWLRSRTPTQYFTQSVTSTDKSRFAAAKTSLSPAIIWAAISRCSLSANPMAISRWLRTSSHRHRWPSRQPRRQT